MEKLGGRVRYLCAINGIFMEVRSSSILRIQFNLVSMQCSDDLGSGGFVPPGWPALGHWLAYLSHFGDGGLSGPHEVTLTL